MFNYWLFVGTAFIFSIALNDWLISLANHKKWFLPAIRPRDEPQQPTPRIGGLAVVLAFLLTVLLIQIFKPGSLNFTGQSFFGLDRNLVGLLVALIIISVVNIADDFRGLTWQTKLTIQVIAAVTITSFGILIPTVSNPFGGIIELGQLTWIFVVLWLVVISNVINWLDSIDGVAGGVSTITLIILFRLSISSAVNQPANATLAVIGAGVALGFLVFNLRGKVFLGDTGSMFLGFLIGVIAIISGGKVATVFLVLAIPFLDALVVVVTRLMGGQSPFQADRRHLIHRLLDRGFKKWQIIGLFYGLSLVFGLIALNTQSLGKFWAILVTMVIMTLLVLLYSFGAKHQGQV